MVLARTINGLRHPQSSRHGAEEAPSSRNGHPGKPTSLILAPNDLWCADFKGQFRTGDGRYCYPLTVTDGFSRFLLGCQGLHSTAVAEAKPVFTRLFKEYGLPEAHPHRQRVPFATNTLARLSSSVGLVGASGHPAELIEPGKPQQNGRHERMHRTLKAETTRPPANSCGAQQRKFDRFRQEFNLERPHEALDLHTPGALLPRLPARCPASFPRWSIRIASRCATVSANGGIRWNRKWVNVSHRLRRRVRRSGGDRRRNLGRLLRTRSSSVDCTSAVCS